MQVAQNTPQSLSAPSRSALAAQFQPCLKRAMSVTLGMSFLLFGGGSLALQQKGTLAPTLPMQVTF